MNAFFRCLIFLLVLTGVLSLIGYHTILFYRPQSIHQWAQCDRASVAFNYFINGFNFFKPQVHNISNGTGITGLEFPIINYLAAIGYSIFGFHEYIYRLIVCFFLAFGLMNAYRLGYLLLKNAVLAALPVYLLIASPVLAYYGISFLSEPVSLAFSLTSWLYFFKWRNNGLKSALLATAIFCSLAVLVKISSLINPFAMLFAILLDYNSGFQRNDAWKKIKQMLPLMLAMIPVIAWYWYAAWLNERYQSKIFLLDIRPVTSWNEFITIWNEIKETWLWRFYPRIYFISIAIASIAIALLPNKVDRLLLRITLLLYAGSLAFIFLLYTQFRVHDYYVIPLMPALFFHWLLIIKQIIAATIKPLYRNISFALILALTCFVTADAKDHLRTAHKKKSWKYSPLVYDRYFYLEPELRKLNIMPGDAVVSIYDVSLNVTLYLMNQRGFTVGPLTPFNDIVKELKKPRYKYAILNNFNPVRFDPAMDSLHLGTKILEWNDLSVYKLGKE